MTNEMQAQSQNTAATAPVGPDVQLVPPAENKSLVASQESTQSAAVTASSNVPAHVPHTTKLDTIVIALTASPESEYAFRWTLNHLLRVGMQKVILLTILSPPIEAGYYYTAGAVYQSSYIEEVQKKALVEASSMLRRYRSQLEAHFNSQMQCDMIVGKGDPRDEIVDFVESAAVDALVVGSRGLGTLKRAFLGSVGDYCVHHCHCPVIVVKHPPVHK